MPEIIYKTYPFTVKEIAERTLEFVGSTEDIDRDGEVVEVAGWKLDNYMKNPVFMWAHDYKEPPIGKALKVWKRAGELKFNIEFAPKETYEFADTIYKLYKGGFLNATSVGFIPDPEGIIDGDGIKTPRRRYTKQELLELSGVSIPSQVNALRNAIDSGVITTKEFEVVTKPEETDEYIHIPVRDAGSFQDGSFRTIDIDKDKGIKAIIGRLKGETKTTVQKYLFAKDKGWTMTKAKEWVKEHENKSFKPHKISQEEIMDEIDYLKNLLEMGISEATLKVLNTLIGGTILKMNMGKMQEMHDMMESCEGMAKKAKKMVETEMDKEDMNNEDHEDKPKRFPGNDIPVDKKDIEKPEEIAKIESPLAIESKVSDSEILNEIRNIKLGG